MPNKTDTYNRLLEKSKEAFLLAIELYNKPSIKYHAEGCAFFLCNAWELMLKAHLIQVEGEKAIYCKKETSRTISLSKCISKVFTNEKDPLRVNLEKIRALRDTSTHFITDEYEIFYGPLFQACVTNFEEKMRELHNFEVSTIIPENYLILSVKKDLVLPENIHAKYPPEVAEKLLAMSGSVTKTSEKMDSPRYAARYETSLAIVKDPAKADLSVRADNNAESELPVAKGIQDVHDKYPYTATRVMEEINRRLNKAGIVLKVKGKAKAFNNYHWKLFMHFYGLKNDERYSFNRATTKEQSNYIYSEQAVNEIVSAIKQDPEHIIETLAKQYRKQ